MDLVRLGWDADWRDAFAAQAERGLKPARVAVEHRELYHLFLESGERSGVVSGRLRNQALGRADFPAVGDWVAVELAEEDGPGVIQAVLPRRNRIARKMAGEHTEEQIIAANLDTVFLVTSLNQDFNLRRLERYLALAWSASVRPVILLNKLDLCPRPEQALAEVERVAFDAPVHAVSAKEGTGLAALERYIAGGQTVALLGSSGVGKSTLVNQLLCAELQPVQEIRLHDGRGRHTTTRRELVLLPQGGMLIDNPGMRELALWDADDGLADVFADVEALASECFFRDCKHQDEPRCAVQTALADGRLDQARFDNYIKLQRELSYLAASQDERLMRERNEQNKRLMARYVRAHRREQRRNRPV